VVLGNLNGLAYDGATPLGNQSQGVYISNAPGNTVGGTASGARDVIAASGANGVLVEGAGATGNRVQGNYVGTDATGALARGNPGNCVAVLGAPGNTVGAEGSIGFNIVSGNGGAGIALSGARAGGNAPLAALRPRRRLGRCGRALGLARPAPPGTPFARLAP
jgi:titin